MTSSPRNHTPFPALLHFFCLVLFLPFFIEFCAARSGNSRFFPIKRHKESLSTLFSSPKLNSLKPAISLSDIRINGKGRFVLSLTHSLAKLPGGCLQSHAKRRSLLRTSPEFFSSNRFSSPSHFSRLVEFARARNRVLSESHSSVVEAESSKSTLSPHFHLTGDPNPFVTGLYQATVSFGPLSSSHSYSLPIDTGSDLTWLNCVPSDKKGSHVYDPSLSTSSSPIKCGSDRCASAQRTQSILPVGCLLEGADECVYQVSYGDGSKTTGYILEEEMEVNGGEREEEKEERVKVTIGCGVQQEASSNGGLVMLDGIMGLGQGPLSLPSQLFSLGVLSERSFAHCLGGEKGGKGALVFGGLSEAERSEMQFTRIVSNQSSMYNVHLEGLSINKKRISNLDESSFGRAAYPDQSDVSGSKHFTAFDSSSGEKAGEKERGNAGAGESVSGDDSPSFSSASLSSELMEGEAESLISTGQIFTASKFQGFEGGEGGGGQEGHGGGEGALGWSGGGLEEQENDPHEDHGFVFFDSGTTLMVMPSGVHSLWQSAVMAEVSALSLSPKRLVASAVCYDFKDKSYSDLPSFFPNVTLHFKGADMELSPENYLIIVEDTVETLACIAWVGIDFPSGSEAITVIGDIVLQNHLVEYDSGRKRVGWKKMDCSTL